MKRTGCTHGSGVKGRVRSMRGIRVCVFVSLVSFEGGGWMGGCGWVGAGGCESVTTVHKSYLPIAFEGVVHLQIWAFLGPKIRGLSCDIL